jgi:intracellular sulfur oxidation DsrE/DsrF family protein
MNRWGRFLRAGVLALACLLASPLLANAAKGDNAVPDQPFVEHRIALQLSDNDPRKESLVISVAFKLLEVYGPDKVAIEVVTFGPGIDLLKRDNAKQQFINSLVAQGVKFDVCGNTLDTIERETGSRPAINPNAVEVAAGVPALLELAEKNYTIVRP